MLSGKWTANLAKTEARFQKLESPYREILSAGLFMEFSNGTIIVSGEGEDVLARLSNYSVEGPTPDQHFQIVAKGTDGSRKIEDVQLLDANHLIFRSGEGSPRIVFEQQK